VCNFATYCCDREKFNFLEIDCESVDGCHQAPATRFCEHSIVSYGSIKEESSLMSSASVSFSRKVLFFVVDVVI